MMYFGKPRAGKAAPTMQRDRLMTRWSSLKTERSSYMAHWQEIAEVLLPRSGRFFTQSRSRGEKRHNSIIDSAATRALRVLGAGMQAGMTSPARPWFRVQTPDKELNEYPAVKLWLHDTTELMRAVFARSNTYLSLHTLYEELGAFGTGASLVVSDFKDVIRHYPQTAGEYCIATDDRGEVTTFYREFQMTVEQVVGRFGRENVSHTIANLYDRGSLDQWVTLIHAIEPRSARDTTKRDAKNMPWKSCYFELGAEDGRYLSESGFKRFAGIAPRWSVRGGEIYGSSPGMEALGDIRQLQQEQYRKAVAIDKKTDPPLQMPTSMQGRDVDSLPGGVTFVDSPGGQQAIRTLYEVNLDLADLLADIQDVRARIDSMFYADMFLMLANDRQGQMTATEVAERHEEKLLMIGPTLERLHNEMLSPMIDITFDHMFDAQLLPPIPEELRGIELEVEFVSVLAQAQRAIGINSIDRFVIGLTNVAAAKPEVLDRLDGDEWVDAYGDALGVNPRIIVPKEVAESLRAERAKQQAAQQQMAAIEQGAAAAKDLAAAPTSGEPTALTDVMSMFSGYTTP